MIQDQLSDLPPYLQFIRNQYGAGGYDIQDDPLTTTVGTTAVRVMPQNPNRVSMKMINPSANNVYVWTDSSVSSTNGIFLLANGGTLVMSVRDDDSLDLINEWWAIASAGASNRFKSRQIFKVA